MDEEVLAPKVLANSPTQRSASELLQSLVFIKRLNPRVGNPGMQLANTFGVIQHVFSAGRNRHYELPKNLLNERSFSMMWSQFEAGHS